MTECAAWGPLLAFVSRAAFVEITSVASGGQVVSVPILKKLSKGAVEIFPVGMLLLMRGVVEKVNASCHGGYACHRIAYTWEDI